MASNQVVGGDSDIVEYQLDGVEAAIAELVDVLADGEAVSGLLHDEATDSPVARLCVKIGLREDGDGVSALAVGDEHLTPVQDVLLAVARSGGLDVLDVAAGLGLGQAERAADVAVRHGGQQAFLLLFGAEITDDGRHDVMRSDDSGDAHPALAELLEDHRHRGVVEAEAAVVFGYGYAEQTQFAHR